MDQFAPLPGAREGVVAVGLVQRHDGGLLFPTLSSAWPVDHAAPFDELLRELDEAERATFGPRR